MPSDLHTHRSGILRMLLAQMKMINASIGHDLTYGEQNEESLRSLLRSVLPAAYGIGSGIVVGTDGAQSKQMDIVIYDQTRVNLAMCDQSHLFFADQVLLAIEVKTNYDAKSLREGIEAIASLKRLKVCPRPWYEVVASGPKTREMRTHNPIPPSGVIFFFFKGRDTGSPIDIYQHLQELKNAVGNIPTIEQPDLMYSYHHASAFRHMDIGCHIDPAQFLTSLVYTSTGKPLALDWDASALKFIIDFEGKSLQEDKVIRFLQISNSTRKSNIAMEAETSQFLDEPTIYRVAKCGCSYHLLDRERGFLNCIESLGELLRHRPVNPTWRATDYFGEDYGNMFEYTSKLA